MHHPVGETAVARRVPIVRIVRVEGHHHAAAAHMAPVTAGERLRAGLGHAERVALVTVPVVHVRGEMRVHRLDRHAVRAPVPGPVRGGAGHIPIVGRSSVQDPAVRTGHA